MNSDELSRGMNNHYTRKPMPSKYTEKNHTYGPGQNYNYQNQYNGNSHYNGGGNSYNNNHNGMQNQRRRPDRFKRDNYNHNDRLIKQNDIIIRLLKEIRDRLPAPAATEAEYFEEDQRMESQEGSSEDQDIQEEDMEVMEPANDNYGSEHDNEYPEDER